MTRRGRRSPRLQTIRYEEEECLDAFATGILFSRPPAPATVYIANFRATRRPRRRLDWNAYESRLSSDVECRGANA